MMQTLFRIVVVGLGLPILAAIGGFLGFLLYHGAKCTGWLPPL